MAILFAGPEMAHGTIVRQLAIVLFLICGIFVVSSPALIAWQKIKALRTGVRAEAQVLRTFYRGRMRYGLVRTYLGDRVIEKKCPVPGFHSWIDGRSRKARIEVIADPVRGVPLLYLRPKPGA